MFTSDTPPPPLPRLNFVHQRNLPPVYFTIDLITPDCIIFLFFIKAGLFFFQNMTRIRCSGKTVNCRIGISNMIFLQSSRLDGLNIAKRLNLVQLFIYDEIIFFFCNILSRRTFTAYIIIKGNIISLNTRRDVNVPEN